MIGRVPLGPYDQRLDEAAAASTPPEELTAPNAGSSCRAATRDGGVLLEARGLEQEGLVERLDRALVPYWIERRKRV